MGSDARWGLPGGVVAVTMATGGRVVSSVRPPKAAFSLPFSQSCVVLGTPLQCRVHPHQLLLVPCARGSREGRPLKDNPQTKATTRAGCKVCPEVAVCTRRLWSGPSGRTRGCTSK